ncbi:hypothetical protein [Aliarcobacter butzleri]|uniref:hypothetical protein n=1 Tax=Aliarcobacter butzleri TaxID=28197 RepID=UPI0021B46FE5|nr:hypothetical protein [Aliarcobacter butzleri]MCT7600296.1 hypothetical protein [Aliarcobacter butzleri]MCT7632973.1 hypothetical protein [Aliarcobacter butzleri]
MQIKLRKKEKDYAQVHKKLLLNPALSLKAKGLGAILECYSDNFEICLQTLSDKSTDGEKAIKSACKELVIQNYLFRFQVLDNNSKFKTIWIFDSECIDQNYKNEILNQFERIYKVDEVPKGHPVADGVPFQDDLKSSIYNNIIYKNIIEDEKEKFEQLNEHLLSKQLSKDLNVEKLENLAQANIHNQVIEIEI